MTMKETEDSFASNLCRCTGYRPILDTFKSFASDASPAMKTKIQDIEVTVEEVKFYSKMKVENNLPRNFCFRNCIIRKHAKVVH